MFCGEMILKISLRSFIEMLVRYVSIAIYIPLVAHTLDFRLSTKF